MHRITLTDYWHSNEKYFNKLNDIQLKNIERDKNKIEYLKKNKIKSLFLWENEIYEFKSNLDIIILNKINEESQNIQGVS
jgi:G:T-mismatch repair DNA endonuclease (very short patch repair protein)